MNVGLVEVVGEDSVEGGDVAGHAAHEAGQQRGEAEAENAGGKEVEQHVGRGHVVVEQRLAAGGEHGLAGDGVDLGRNQAAALFHVGGTTVVSRTMMPFTLRSTVVVWGVGRPMASRPGRITRKGKKILGTAAMSGTRRADSIFFEAMAVWITRKSVHQ